MMRLLLSLLIACLALPLAAQGPDTPVSDGDEPVSSDAAPDEADEKADDETAELQAWFAGLSDERKAVLRSRLRVVRRVSPAHREQMLEQGEFSLSEPDRERLDTLRDMTDWRRAHLQGMAIEMSFARRMNEEGFEQANALEGAERVEALHRLLRRYRGNHGLRAMTPEQREEFTGLDRGERVERMRELRARALDARRELVGEHFPQLEQLRAAAEQGDTAAAEILAELLRDVAAIDFLARRMGPDARAKVFEAAGTQGFQAGAEAARQQVASQFRRDIRRTPPRDRNNNGITRWESRATRPGSQD